MLISRQTREENIAEYVLYMWQIEDLIRANKLDIELIQKNIIDGFEAESEEVKADIRKWYEDLIDMMRHEDAVEKGHLQVNKNVIATLSELHLALLQSHNNQDYNSLYYKTLPFIVELRAKGADKSKVEIETCFDALYGYLLLKLQQKEVSGETQAAIAQIGSLLRLLSSKYRLDKANKLEL